MKLYETTDYFDTDYKHTRLGFEFEGMFITNPILSICARFEVDPIKEYGLTQSEVDRLMQFNEEEIKKQMKAYRTII